MKTKKTNKNLKVKVVLQRVLCFVLVVAMVTGIWQLNEYRKLRNIILPQGEAYQVPDHLPDYVQTAVRENRQPYLEQKSDAELQSFHQMIQIPDYDKDQDEWMAGQVMESWQSDHWQPEYITLGQAAEDLQYPHTYIKYGSAHYAYYGGSDVFEPLFDDMLSELEASAIDDFVVVNDFQSLIQHRVLWVLRDHHAYIHGLNFNGVFPEQKYHSYYTEAIYFDDNLETVYQEQSYRLLQINSADPMDYLKPTILESGEFAYIPWDYTNVYLDAEQIEYRFELEDGGGNATTIKINLERVPDYQVDETVGYRLSEQDAYFNLINSSFQPNVKDELSQMIREAPMVRGNKPIVIDLRGHAGGWDVYGLRWLLRYLDVSVVQFLNLPIPSYCFDLETQTALSMQKGRYVSSLKGTGLNERYSGSGEVLHIANDTPIYVVIDRVCGSSGEWFVSYLRRLDNVVLVGEPTHGLLMGGNTSTTWLPNSQVRCVFSMSLNSDSDLRDLEGYGYTPDIYIPAESAVDRLITMIERNQS